MEDLLNRINTKHCSACKKGEHYFATYIGPGYAEAKVKILFIGLDAGADSQSYDLLQRQAGILDCYKTNNWNQHYRGSIWVASYILGSLCLTQCASRCSSRCVPEHGRECVLRLFAQGNAVKCIPAGSTRMDFKNRSRISDCLPLMFGEIQVLRPNVIVLQGRNDLHEPFFNVVKESGGERVKKREFVSLVTWANGVGRAIVVSLNHPSHGHLQKDWESDIIPALDEARRLLSAEATSGLGAG